MELPFKIDFLPTDFPNPNELILTTNEKINAEKPKRDQAKKEDKDYNLG